MSDRLTFSTDQILSSLTARDLRSAGVLSDISHIRQKLDMVEREADADADFALHLGAAVLQDAIDFGDKKAKTFATSFISHLTSGGDVASFLAQYPDYNELDLGGFMDRRPEYKKLLEPVAEISLQEILFSAVPEEPTDFRKNGNQKILHVKIENSVNPESRISNFDELAEKFPIVAELFSDSDFWTKSEDTEYISLSDVRKLFEQKNLSKTQDQVDLAILQGVTNLLNLWIIEDRKPRKQTLVNAGGSKRSLSISRGDLEDFLLFAHNRSETSKKSNLKIREDEKLPDKVGKKKLK